MTSLRKLEFIIQELVGESTDASDVTDASTDARYASHHVLSGVLDPIHITAFTSFRVTPVQGWGLALGYGLGHAIGIFSAPES